VVNRPKASNEAAVVQSPEFSISVYIPDRHEPHAQQFECLGDLIEIARKRAILIDRMKLCLANGSASELREIAEAVCGLRSE
jgi:hypothetical protein